jgi:hypothetical protein
VRRGLNAKWWNITLGEWIALLENGDEYFPAMLSAIRSPRTAIRGV